MVELWRVGRHLGRTIYRQIGNEPSVDDEFLGIMDTRTLAEQIVEAVNLPRDEYHTMDELYEYRMLYNAAFANLMGDLPFSLTVTKSWRHSDGELCFGGDWFIVTMQLPQGQVSNHYEAYHWDLFRVPEVETAPVWDGHTPAEAAERLRAFCKEF